jgi:hypothetical protein
MESNNTTKLLMIVLVLLLFMMVMIGLMFMLNLSQFVEDQNDPSISLGFDSGKYLTFPYHDLLHTGALTTPICRFKSARRALCAEVSLGVSIESDC